MNITSKSRYALRAVIHLARLGNKVARREDLSAAQGGISVQYLEKILLQLRRSGIVQAKSGRGGGYQLARPASKLTVWDVVRAVEGSPAPVACLGAGSAGCGADCEARSFWSRMWAAAVGEMKAATIASLAAESGAIETLRDLPARARMTQCR